MTRTHTLLQVTVEGGTAVTTVAALATFLVATVLAVLVTYRFIQGYVRSRSKPVLLLAVGMFLLAPAPMFIRLVAGNVFAVAPPVRVLSTTTVEAAGLLVILGVIYWGGR
jgi:multisubunit Na+/H+ antiporter MnhF subunit